MDEKDLIIHDIPVTVYGNLEKYNETISKGRCRIFYKGANRNGTFITDEFADKLLSTIAYAPVKGIFSDDEDDYRCGSKYGTRCPSGECCSKHNWCGKSSDHCGSGCQSEFGACN